MVENIKVAHINEAVQKKSIVNDIKNYIKSNYNLRRNIISRNIELDFIPIDDIILNDIFIGCKTNINKATKDLVNSILFSNFIEQYSPFVHLLEYYGNNPPEKKTGHIKNFIKSIHTDTPNAEKFIKKWLISIMGSIDGNHSPLMLVLTGGQNTGKTYWFRHFLPESLRKYYAESKLDLGKDDEILMTKKLIIMDDEMGGKSKQEQKKLKEMTSKQIFSIREPYGRVSLDLQRLAILCGTTNDEEILNDPTGNRRILPVRVLNIDRTLYNSINKDYLFYEIYLEYKKGVPYELDDEDIEVLKFSSMDFKQSTPEDELVSKYFGLPGEASGIQVEMTNSEILSYIQTRNQAKLSQTKLGLVLKQMGFEQKHHKINNTTIRKYTLIEINYTVVNEQKPPF